MARQRFRRINTGFRQIAGSAATIGPSPPPPSPPPPLPPPPLPPPPPPILPPPPPPTPTALVITAVSGLTPGGTSIASLTFAGGAPATLTALLDGATITPASPVITTTTGSGATAAGTASFAFPTPAAATHALVAASTGPYAVTSNSFSFVTAVVVLPPPPPPPPPVTVFMDHQVFARDAYTGNPAGFATTFGKGWGKVPIQVTAPAPGPLYLRLHNALDAAAQATVAGTGAIVQPAMLVAGVTLATGVNNLLVDLPAGAAWFYVDLGLSAAMTTVQRLPAAVGVGALFGVGSGTSHAGGWVTDWQYFGGAPDINQMVAISEYGVVYCPYSINKTVATERVWRKPGNYASSPYNSAWAAEFLRLSVNRLGVVCAMVGAVELGGVSYNWGIYNLTGNYGSMVNALNQALFRQEVQMSLTGNDGSYPPGDVYRVRKAIWDDMRARAGRNFGSIWAFSPLVDDNGASTDWGIFHDMCRRAEREQPNTVNVDWACAGGNGVNGHMTMCGRMQTAWDYYRLAMGFMGTAKGGFAMRRGPSVVSGTRSGSVITLNVVHDGGTALVPFGYNDPGNALAIVITDPATITAQGLGWIFTVYWAGYGFDSADQTKFLNPLVGAAITGPSTITLTLLTASTPAATIGLDVHVAMDLTQQHSHTNFNSGKVAWITDNSNDGDGIPRGRPLRRSIDPIYIPPPNPSVAQSITLDTPLGAMPGAWLRVTGTGTGAPLGNRGLGRWSTSIGISFNGGPLVIPDFLTVTNDNNWSGLARVPTTLLPGASVTVAAFRVGQASPDATATVLVVDGRTELPDPDGTGSIRLKAALSFDCMNRGAMWADAAKTRQVTEQGFVRVWRDQISGVEISNPLAADDTDCPSFDPRMRSWSGSRMDHRLDRPSLFTGGTPGAPGGTYQKLYNLNCAAALTGLEGDMSAMIIGYGLFGHNVMLGDMTNASWQGSGYRFGGSQGDFTAFCQRQSKTQQAQVNGPVGSYPDVVFHRYNAAAKTHSIWNRDKSQNWALVAAPVVSAMAISTAMPPLGGIIIGYSFDGQPGTGRHNQIILFRGLLTDAECQALFQWSGHKHPFVPI